MSVGHWLVWGFAATVVLTTLLVASQGMRLTRMNIPYMLGTIFTPDRDRAQLLGVLVHLANGWLFSLVYIAAFRAWGGPSVGRGVLIGLVHAAFVLTAGMRALPGLHPRMASETRGPTVTPELEPPGFLALHYGLPTPVSVVVAHAAFGAVLGAYYRP